MIIKRSITFRDTLQSVIEVDHNLAQRHIVKQLDAVSRYIFLLQQLSPLAKAKRHDRSDIIGSCNNGSFDIRLFYVVNHCRIGHTAGIMNFRHIALLIVDMIRYVRNRSNDVHIELTIQTLLYNFHVKQPQETATETESQRQRRFRLESQRSIVQLQLLKRSPQIFKFFGLNRINSGKHHRLHLFKSGNRFITRTGYMGNRISHFHLFRGLNTGNDISNIPRP